MNLNGKTDIASVLKGCLNKNKAPVDLKPLIIGEVVSLEPLTVATHEKKAFWVENEELFISEWFRYRCNIDKTNLLSQAVPGDLQNAQNVTETHSYTGSPCAMPNAISYLANAIGNINSELLALKCELKVGDLVVIGSLEQTDRYILLDKVL